MTKLTSKVPFLLADGKVNQKILDDFNAQNGTNYTLKNISEFYSGTIWKVLQNKKWNS